MEPLPTVVATMSKKIGATTFTVRVEEAALPEESETLYVTAYVPTAAVFTVFAVMMEPVTSPSTPSIALAPASLYMPPRVTDVGFDPKSVSNGGVVSGVARTWTVREMGSAALP